MCCSIDVFREYFPTSEKIFGGWINISGHCMSLREIKMVCFIFQVTGFRSYVDLYLKDKVDEIGNALNVVHEVVNERWEVCLTMSEKGFQQVSFVNSIATTKVKGNVHYTLWSLSHLWPLFKKQVIHVCWNIEFHLLNFILFCQMV